jgi:ADP-ribosylglycohydrolase
LARSVPVGDRARGALLGLARGYSGARLEPNLTGEVALAALLAEELLETEVDLRRLAERWITWWRRDGRGLGMATAEALEYLARYDAPLTLATRPDSGPLVRVVPVSLAAANQPRNLVSGTWHTVMLTTPDAITAWSAVAVNVALAQLLQGRRDFLPDVVEALRANDASTEVLSAVRRIPFVQQDELDGGGHAAVAAVELSLWNAHHEPLVERAFKGPAAGPGDGPALVAALLGGREGEQALPLGSAPEEARLRALAKRLVTPRVVPQEP